MLAKKIGDRAATIAIERRDNLSNGDRDRDHGLNFANLANTLMHHKRYLLFIEF